MVRSYCFPYFILLAVVQMLSSVTRYIITRSRNRGSFNDWKLSFIHLYVDFEFISGRKLFCTSMIQNVIERT